MGLSRVDMEAQVTAATIAGSVAAIGWFVSYLFTSLQNIATQKRAATLAHIEKQLEELYGPLAFLVYEGRQTFEELLLLLGRDYVFDENDQISSQDLEIWLFWAESDFIPRNRRIKKLLSTKTHLLYKSEMVESYLEFLNHHNSWMIQHLRWQQQHVPYPWHSRINWSEQFETDVLDAFNALRENHAKLIART
jgi:hypothetical protein